MATAVPPATCASRRNHATSSTSAAAPERNSIGMSACLFMRRGILLPDLHPGYRRTPLGMRSSAVRLTNGTKPSAREACSAAVTFSGFVA